MWFLYTGIIMSMYNMYENKIKPTEENIDKFLSEIYVDVQVIFQLKMQLRICIAIKVINFQKVKLLDY